MIHLNTTNRQIWEADTSAEVAKYRAKVKLSNNPQSMLTITNYRRKAALPRLGFSSSATISKAEKDQGRPMH